MANVKTWEQTYIEFLVRLSKPINHDLPMGWSIWTIDFFMVILSFVSSLQTYRHSFHGMVADRTRLGKPSTKLTASARLPRPICHNKYSRSDFLSKKKPL